MPTQLIAVFLTLTFLSSGCAQREIKIGGDGTKAVVSPLAGKFEATRFRLANGLKLVVVEDHSSPTFAYQTWFRVGSRDEDVGRTGLAHLFEHMMFKETKSLKEGEFDRVLEGAGAEGENAFTSRDYTAYVQEMPADKLDLIMKLESDRMVNLLVNEKAFKTETEVVQNERRMREENNPDGLMYKELFANAFTTHPYRWPVIGYQQDLNAMTGEDALKFYRNWYSPNHATVVVIGDVHPEEVRAKVEKYYGGLASVPEPTKPVLVEPEQTAPRRNVLKLAMQVEKLLMGWHVPDVTHADMPAINVMQMVLSGGKSSRLHRALVETGIATSVDSEGLEDKDPSLFVVEVSLQKKKKAAHAERVVIDTLARLAREPIPQKELERARNRLSFHFFGGLNSNISKAHFIGRNETISQGFEQGVKDYEKTQTVTGQQVQAVVSRYLAASKRTVITGVPK